MSSHSSTVRALVLVATLVGPGACSVLSGADDYAAVQRCTGPACGVCPAGQASCGDVCCAQGDRCGDAARSICVEACRESTSECGVTCCTRTQHCASSPEGERCSACLDTALECGDGCCGAGETCLDRTRGVCSATWSAAKSGQSCTDVDTCLGGDGCCTSLDVPGGAFAMGRGLTGTDKFPGPERELPEHSVTVSPYALDKYEVTVARFRRFVNGWDYTPPPSGTGAHPRIPRTGWDSAWNDRLPASRAALEARLGCNGALSTYGRGDRRPINCVDWYTAFVFCAWDGGRLPTEAEWEFAAANGAANTMAPWGPKGPTGLASYGCTPPCALDSYHEVGSYPKGANALGHLDLSGNVSEWVFDAFDLYAAAPQEDPAVTGAAIVRATRGGSALTHEFTMRAVYRIGNAAPNSFGDLGLRCARAHTAP